ncbi:MAG: colicin immunity domain-containing protein [Bacteroidia bacterium]|nr:colicin immunity domain-containing protein [Bacteroidia bacterium]
MVNNESNLLDKIHLQKYIYLLSLFHSEKIETALFENLFLQIRREDNYWLSGKFHENVSKVLDTFFLDVDAYNPDELFDLNDKFNINEVDLKKRASETLKKLSDWL